MESFKESFIKEKFPDLNFIQDNESESSYGVLRGLHYQNPPFEQTKLVRVIKGEILDVVVDLRKDSLTFGKWLSVKLCEVNKHQLLIPRGFAHGFLTLSDKAIIAYKVDNEYSRDHESGIIYNDSSLNINWGEISKEKIILSKKDLQLNKFIV